MSNFFHLRVFHQNAQCLRNKLNLFEIELEKLGVDVACISEHWLKESELQLLKIRGYNICTAFTRNKMKNGGVLIMYKSILDSIKFCEITAIKDMSVPLHCEAVGAEIIISNSIVIKIICLYRSTDGDLNIFYRELNRILGYVLSTDCSIVLCGDLNINFLANDMAKHQLFDIFHSYELVSHIQESTRLNSGLDYICSNINHNFSMQSATIIKNGLSDHSAQLVKFNLNNGIKPKKIIRQRIFNQENYNTFLNIIKHESWSEVYRTDNIEKAFEIFSETLIYYIDISFPLVTIRNENKSQSKWITEGIRVSSEKLKLLYNIKVTTNAPEHKNYYRKYKNIYRKVCAAAKKLENDSSYHSAANKSKAIWSIINKDINNKKTDYSEISEIFVNNQQISNPHEIANNFNKYFVNISSKLMQNNSKTQEASSSLCNIRDTLPSFFIGPVNKVEVFNKIMGLKSSNCCGVDQISSNVLKSAVNYITEPLSFLINRSFQEGIFPRILKIAKVLPLFKKGQTTEMNNYRPISILSNISKIIEKIMHGRMVSFAAKYGIFQANQHGFREGRSTQTAIYNFLSNLYENVNNNKKNFGIFLDLSKAFDLVDHDMLIDKLYKYGFRGMVGDWLRSYLSERKQLTVVNTYQSNMLKISCGVPQGSVLGPMLFLLYINDIALCVKDGSMVLFADDTSYLFSDKDVISLTEQLQIRINKLVEWFDDNRLHINNDKSVFIHFTPRTNELNLSYLLKIHGKSIMQVQSTKFLGLHINNSLNWEVHIDFLCKKLASICFAFYRLKELTSRSVMLSFYYAHCYSRLKYGIIFWGSSSYVQRVFILQKRIVRYIASLGYRQSCRGKFKELRILPLPCIYILELLLQVKSNIQDFRTNDFHHNYFTRNRNDLMIPPHNSVFYEKSPLYMGILFYNRIPQHIRSLPLNRFKSLVKKMLTDNCFYSVEEYLQYEYEF